jgi:hypothetical protein
MEKKASELRYEAGPKKGDKIAALGAAAGESLSARITQLATDEGTGTVRYTWPELDNGGNLSETTVTTRFRFFEPLGWIIGVTSQGDDAGSTARESVRKYLRRFRYGADQTDYFWIHSFDPNNPEEVVMLMHPILPSLENTDMSRTRYSRGERQGEIIYARGIQQKTPFLVHLNRTIAKNGEGFVHYDWPKPSKNGISAYAEKVSFGKLISDWNWVVGTGVYLDDVEEIRAASMSNTDIGSHKTSSGNRRRCDPFHLCHLVCPLFTTSEDPGMKAVSNLPDSLEMLIINFSYNKLSGVLPFQFGNYPNLEELLLQGNEFEGALPDSLTNFCAMLCRHVSPPEQQQLLPPSYTPRRRPEKPRSPPQKPPFTF